MSFSPDWTSDDGFMAIAAVRYCVGRRTYASQIAADWLIKHWGKLPANTRSTIRRDLEEEFRRDDEARASRAQYNPLGDDCDRRQWERVRCLWRSDGKEKEDG